MPLTYAPALPDLVGMDDQSGYDQRDAAIEWLIGDPTHRAIIAPTELDAVLDMYRARDEHPDMTFTRNQFITKGQPVGIGVETRYVEYRSYYFM